MFVRALLYKRREENQLDATEWFIALIICSTRFGHLYAHHQELETMLVLLPHMVCNALVAGGRRSVAGQQAMRPGWGKLCDWLCHVVHGWGEWPVRKEGLGRLGIQTGHSPRPCTTWQSQLHSFPHPRCIACFSAPNSRPPATKALYSESSSF